MARKKVKIDTDTCIGCCTCMGVFPEDFNVGTNDVAESITGEAEQEAEEVCPVHAITFED